MNLVRSRLRSALAELSAFRPLVNGCAMLEESRFLVNLTALPKRPSGGNPGPAEFKKCCLTLTHSTPMTV
jgi:hypothetical protein